MLCSSENPFLPSLFMDKLTLLPAFTEASKSAENIAFYTVALGLPYFDWQHGFAMPTEKVSK